MKAIICILVLSSHTLKAQNAASIAYGPYCFVDSVKNTITLQLSHGNQFELLVDSDFDCTPAYLVFGKGQFSVDKDSIALVFDSIPSLRSTYTIDSIDNTDNTIDIQFHIIDHEQKPVSGVTLNWGKPIRKNRRITSEFFTKKIDSSGSINLQKGEKVSFLRIEKAGFYEQEIDLCQIMAKDYLIAARLNPKPGVRSNSYISNTKIKLRIASSTGIELQDRVCLKAGQCK